MIYLLNGGVIWSLPTPDTKWNKIVNYFLINQIIAGKKGDPKSLGFFPKSLGFSLSPPKHESKRHVLVTKFLPPRCHIILSSRKNSPPPLVDNQIEVKNIVIVIIIVSIISSNVIIVINIVIIVVVIVIILLLLVLLLHVLENVLRRIKE